ncbi:DUF4913 domain-containing protein [Aeromicrobium sp. CF4.19]|uniref:DUF4913 domain-containing protein n=1 Tax=Aeromicrobium sp. CF4.19 TaxID=3373082 RepID=UPI003EE62EAD
MMIHRRRGTRLWTRRGRVPDRDLLGRRQRLLPYLVPRVVGATPPRSSASRRCTAPLKLRREAAPGISAWLHDQADYHMNVLTDPRGRFKGCSPSRAHDAKRARIIPADESAVGFFEPAD